MKIKGGYYIKARKIQESEISTAPPYVREIWDWLLKEANHKEKKYGKFMIKRGQLFRTYKNIREGLAWYIGYRKMTYNENQTKKAMRFLREHRMIDTTKELGGVLITICNYELYQNPKNYERTNERTNEGTNKEPMENQPLPDNNKNEKNEKNVKETCKRILVYFNEILNKKLTLTLERKNVIISCLNKNRTEEQIKKAIDNFILDDWPDRYNYIDLVYCMGVRNKIDNFDKWYNYKSKSNKQSTAEMLRELEQEEKNNGGTSSNL